MRTWDVPLAGLCLMIRPSIRRATSGSRCRSGAACAVQSRHAGVEILQLPTPDSGPHGLVSDAGGNIWFTENYAGKIGRLDAGSGVITEFKAPRQRTRTRRYSP